MTKSELIERIAQKQSQLVYCDVELAVKALDHREWPRSALEIQMLRSCLFTAQAIARDMIAAGRGEEVEDIRREISKIVHDHPEESADT